MGNLFIILSKMKFLALTALIAAAAAGTLTQGESCAEDNAGCEAGLCCGQGIYKDDVVDGEVKEGYEANAVFVCNAEAADEYANEDGEEYWFSCLETATEGNAKALTASVAAFATAAYLML